MFLLVVGFAAFSVQVLAGEGQPERSGAFEPYLFLAVKKEKLEMVRLLAEYVPDIDVYNDRWLTPLHMAMTTGQWAMADFLQSKGADINKLDPQFGWALLHRLAIIGDAFMVDKLLVMIKNVRADLPDAQGWTPLYYAMRNGHEEVVKKLQGRFGNWASLTEQERVALETRAAPDPVAEALEKINAHWYLASALAAKFALMESLKESHGAPDAAADGWVVAGETDDA